MEGVDWMMALAGLGVMIGFVIVAWSIEMLLDAMKRHDDS